MVVLLLLARGPADTDGGPEAAGNGSIAGDGLAATS